MFMCGTITYLTHSILLSVAPNSKQLYECTPYKKRLPKRLVWQQVRQDILRRLAYVLRKLYVERDQEIPTSRWLLR